MPVWGRILAKLTETVTQAPKTGSPSTLGRKTVSMDTGQKRIGPYRFGACFRATLTL